MKHLILVLALALGSCKKDDPEPAPPPPPTPARTEAMTTFEISTHPDYFFDIMVNWDADPAYDTAFLNKKMPTGAFTFKFEKLVKQKTIEVKANLYRPATDTSSKLSLQIKAVKFYVETAIAIHDTLDLW